MAAEYIAKVIDGAAEGCQYFGRAVVNVFSFGPERSAQIVDEVTRQSSGHTITAVPDLGDRAIALNRLGSSQQLLVVQVGDRAFYLQTSLEQEKLIELARAAVARL